MAKKKIYAVAKGKTVGLFDTWEACKDSVDGFSGAVYKSFSDKGEAEAFLLSNEVDLNTISARISDNGPSDKSSDKNSDTTGDNTTTGKSGSAKPKTGKAVSAKSEADTPDTPQAHLTAYVDGSFNVGTQQYAFGCVMLMPDGKVETFSGSGNEPESALLRNVTGEMLGAMHSVKWCIEHGYNELEICYDYAGIEKWATGEWKTNKELTQKYAAYMRERMRIIKIHFTKVAAHTGVKWNEEADRLAKEAIGL